MTKHFLKKIDGIFLLNKPLNMTSNQALQYVKRLFRAKKAGHTGSLDPLATGMLPICFGEATKFSQFLLESDKHYEVSVQLGIKTSTGDAEGKIISTKPVKAFDIIEIEQVLKQFVGKIQQIPPMFSAIKYQGKPLYELARKGIEIERKPRPVTIFHLHLKNFHLDQLQLDVHCSKGTYVRTLVEDIGEQLGCGASIRALHRSIVSPYHHSSMHTLAELEASLRDGIDAESAYLLPVETSVQSFPGIQLSSAAIFYLRTGQSVNVSHSLDTGWISLFSEQSQFLGVGEIVEKGRIIPRRLIQAQA